MPRAQKHIFVAYAADAATPLASFVAARLSLSPTEATALVRGGSVYIGDKRQRSAQHALAAGDRVTIYLAPAASEPAGEPERILVVFQNDDLAVIDKPAGVASAATRAGGERTVEEQLGIHACRTRPGAI